MNASEAAKTLGISARQVYARQAPEQAVLAALMTQYPQIARKAWRVNVIKRLPEFVIDPEEAEDIGEIIREFTYLPDAFACYPQDQQIDFFEAEVTSMMKPAKLQAYARMMVELDFYEINMQLLTINQHRHMHPVDLWPHYIDWLKS